MNLNFPYELKDIGDGLQLLLVPMQQSPSVTVAISAGVGARHEDPAKAGISHLIEHMAFKGTTKRPTALDISTEIESLGGESNAATGYEYTYYYVKMPAYQWEKALDIVSDLTLNPRYPEQEMQKEKQVILQEYKMYQDSPHRRLASDFRSMIWPRHPLGTKIEGEPATLLSITREDILSFRQAYYKRNNLLICIGGNFDTSKVEKQVYSIFANILSQSRQEYQSVDGISPQDRLCFIPRKQEAVDVVLGFKGITRQEVDKLDVLGVMNTILGRGASSRLYQHIREELGLTYYIGSGHTDYQDDGLFTIQAGVSKENVEKAIQAILIECAKLTEDIVDEKELKKAKEFMKGSLLLGLETSDDVLQFYAFQKMLDPIVRTPQQLIERIDAITTDEIRSVAQELFKKDNVYVGVIGPLGVREEKKLRTILSNFKKTI